MPSACFSASQDWSILMLTRLASVQERTQKEVALLEQARDKRFSGGKQTSERALIRAIAQ